MQPGKVEARNFYLLLWSTCDEVILSLHHKWYYHFHFQCHFIFFEMFILILPLMRQSFYIEHIAILTVI